MQKLQEEFKNIPTDTSLVCSSISSGLNKEKTPSDQSIVLTCNNPEENLRQHRAGSNLRVLNVVYVLNKRGLPLMPTCQSRARRLLNAKKAVVIKRYPFVIQLTCTTGEVKQSTLLGIDSAYKYIGISVVSNKQELFSAEVVLRTDLSEKISEKRMYSRGRRNRHHWYRSPRFNNRTRKGGWLSPSLQHKVDSHVNTARKISKIVPISEIDIETAKFDIQQINNLEISGKEYQNGVQKDFWNIREYVLYRDKHTCQYCKKGNVILNVHHIESRMTGGNRPDNLITLCEKCHNKYHKGKIKLAIKIKDNFMSFKSETAMSIIRKAVINELKKDFVVRETFGYITKSRRIERKIGKTHINDAFVIANGNNQDRHTGYYVEQKRKNNRCLQLNRSGYAPSIRKRRYIYQPKDLVKYNGKLYRVVGAHSYGKSIIIQDSKIKLDISAKKLGWHFCFNSFCFVQDSIRKESKIEKGEYGNSSHV